MMQKYGFQYSLEDFETLELQNYFCPSCGSMDRERLYYLYFNTFAKCNEKLMLLDIAPSASLSKHLKSSNHFKYISCDLFQKDVDFNIDIMDMKIFPESTFDCLICSHVLEHVTDDMQALRELFRILKKGGWAILMVPIALKAVKTDENIHATVEERWKYFGQDDHVRLYAKQDFIQRISQAGFAVEQYCESDFHDISFKHHGINPKSVLYVAKKL
jgi:SAM-dependent methyltransferase